MPPHIAKMAQHQTLVYISQLVQLLQGSQAATQPVPAALSIRNPNAPSKPPSKAAAGKRTAPAAAKARAGGASAAASSGPADDDDAGLAAGTLSKAEAEEKLLELFGEGPSLFCLVK